MIRNSNHIEDLVKICHSNLRSSKKCLSYLVKDRGLTKRSIIENRLGFFPQNVDVLKKYVPEDVLIKSSIIGYSRGSDFSDYFYLVFPIFTEYGEAIGISGRSLMSDQERSAIGIPKYKNSSYKKANILYGLNSAKEKCISKNNVFVVEGYFDQIAMRQNGLENTVAICGTSFSQNHFLKLARYTDKLTFILDSDDAGIKSAERIYSKYINKGIKLRFLRAPSGVKDVDEYFRSNSTSSFFKDFKQVIPDAW